MKIIIIGAGKLGFDLARILSQEKHDIIVVDKDPNSLKPIADNFDVMTVCGNGASVALLREIDVETADLLLAVTDNDELNIIASMLAKRYKVKTTLARVRNPEYTQVLSNSTLPSYHEFGIDIFLNPEYLAAQEVFRLLEVPNSTAIDYLADGKISLITIKIDENSVIIGQKICNLKLAKYTVVAIMRNGDVLIPTGNTELLLNDRIYVMGKTAGYHNLSQLIQEKKAKFKRIIIGGGGLLTEYLVQLLHTKKNSPEIRVLEPSLERCKQLSQILEDCCIIQGDPTRIENLEEESIGKDDIFFATTGSDNSNIVACMLAEKMGVTKSICEISREDYIYLTDNIGVDSTITPRLLTVSLVLKLIKSKTGNVLSLNLLNDGKVEVLELMALPDSPITQVPLKDLQFPGSTVVGAIMRGNDTIVPRGDTSILPGDRVILFALRSKSDDVEKLFHNDTGKVFTEVQE